MSDYTMGGFWSASIASGTAFLIVTIKYHFEQGIALFLVCYVAGLFAFFGYMGFKKGKEYSDQWNSEEIIAGFLGSALALWPSVLLMFITDVFTGYNFF